MSNAPKNSHPLKIQPDEKNMLAETMPHYFSWCFGWDDLVRGVAKAYESVPAHECADTAIFANDFASAGAIDRIGPKRFRAPAEAWPSSKPWD